MAGFFTQSELVKKTEKKVDIEQLTPDCGKCGLYKHGCLHPKMDVTGEGSKKILIIGEAPRHEEDEFGIHLVGENGDFLKKELRHLRIALHKDCWKIGAVNCRTPQDRVPTHKEIKCCYPMIQRAILKLKPKLIVLLGSIAITSVFGENFSNRKVLRWRAFQIPDEKFKCYVLPLFHPWELVRKDKDKNLHSTFKRDLKRITSSLDKVYEKQTDFEKYVVTLTNFIDVKSLLKRILKRKQRFAFDYEATGLKPYRNGHKIVTIALAISAKKAYAFPFDFNSFWTKSELSEIKALWKEILAHPDIEKIAHNCFSGKTEYITKNGIKSFTESENTIQQIWTSNGWKFAEIKKFGQSITTNLTLVPYNRSRSSIVHEVNATDNHRWIIYRKKREGTKIIYNKMDNVLTNELKEKDRIFAEFPKFEINQNSDAFRHGLVFADGTRTSSSKLRNNFAFQIRLCGDKEKFKNSFDKYTYPPSANGDPIINHYKSEIDLKEVPECNNAQYIAEFIEGWQLLDGTNSTSGESRIITTIDRTAAYWLKNHAAIGGWICSGFSEHENKAGYNDNLKYWMIILTRQSDISWTIREIKRNKKIEDVFCATVINGKDEFTLQHGIYTKNSKFEDAWSAIQIGTRVRNMIHCTMIGQKVCDNRAAAVGLKFQAFVRYGVRPYDDSIAPFLKSKKGGEFNTVEKAPLKDLLVYNGLDCIFTFMLYNDQIAYFSVMDKLYDAFKFFMRGLRTMGTVQLNGIRMNTEYYEKINIELEESITTAKKELTEGREAKKFKEQIGKEINITSNADLGKLFYDVLGKAPIYTSNNNYKTDAVTLESLNLPFVDKLISMKKLEKAKGTYLAQFAREVYNGKMHPFFDLHIPVSYRSSSSMPNFQNIPNRNPIIKALIRKGIIPGVRRVLAEADFGGAEIITSACYHKDPTFIHDITIGDMHRDLAIELFKLPFTLMDKHHPGYSKAQIKMIKEIRFYSKNNWTFAQFYGDWFGSCAPHLWENVVEAGLTLTNGETVRHWLEGQGIYELGEMENYEPSPGSFLEHCKNIESKMWKERFPVYTEWKEDIVESYQRYGFIETYFGFRFTGYMDKKQCTNFPIQSTSFHLLLHTLIKVEQFLRKNKCKTKMIGQIHDSCILDMPVDEIQFVVKGMNDIVVGLKEEYKWLIVPMEIDVDISRSRENGGNFSEMKEFTPAQVAAGDYKHYVNHRDAA